MKKRHHHDTDDHNLDELIARAATLRREVAALEAEAEQQSARLFSFALGLFLGVSLFGCDGD